MADLPVRIEARRRAYSEHWPHSSLGRRTSNEFVIHGQEMRMAEGDTTLLQRVV
jgi:hypothetical protein